MLNHSIGESLQVFCDRKTFSGTRNHKPAQGKLRLQFSPVMRTVAILDDCLAALAPPLPWEKNRKAEPLEWRIARYFGISLDELLACLQGTVTDESVFQFEYSPGPKETCVVKCDYHSGFLPMRSLSSGERSRVVVDIAVRIAMHATTVSPVALLVHQGGVYLLRGGRHGHARHTV